jgi:hypothetical protein
MVFFLAAAGCESPHMESGRVIDRHAQASVYDSYKPEKLELMPLTEFVSAGEEPARSQIKVYVSLLDKFGCQMKTPGVFRFELYERVERSAEPKGRRVAIWPDADLTTAAQNNDYWRDFLRSYEFGLDFERHGGGGYILQVTCLCADGARLSDEFTLTEK